MRRFIGTVLVVWALSACSAGGDASPSPSPSTMSDAQILAIGREVAACVRDNGVPDFPDPYVDKGRLLLPDEAEQNLEQKYTQQVLDQAMQSCQSIMDRLPESAIKGEDEPDTDPGQEPGPGDIEALKKFAQCVRDNGVPEWPDPKADGSFPLRGTPLETEAKERIGNAVEPCQKHWSGRIRVS